MHGPNKQSKNEHRAGFIKHQVIMWTNAQYKCLFVDLKRQKRNNLSWYHFGTDMTCVCIIQAIIPCFCYLLYSNIFWNILKERTGVMSRRNFSTRSSWRNAEISFLQPKDSVLIFEFIYICGWNIFKKNSLRFYVLM